MKKLKLCLLGLMLTGISYGQSHSILSPSDSINCTTIQDTIHYTPEEVDSIFTWFLGFEITVDTAEWQWTIMQGEAMILLEVVNNAILELRCIHAQPIKFNQDLFEIRRILCDRIKSNCY